MRSRYSAFAVGAPDYLFRTWHPRTRPVDTSIDPDTVWTGLEVTDTKAGAAGDRLGEVEFIARFERKGRPATMQERSRFERRSGHWVYVDGDVRD